MRDDWWERAKAAAAETQRAGVEMIGPRCPCGGEWGAMTQAYFGPQGDRSAMDGISRQCRKCGEWKSVMVPIPAASPAASPDSG